MHGDSREDEYAAYLGTRDDRVERAYAVREGGRCEYRGGVDDRHEIEGERRTRASLREREGHEEEEVVTITIWGATQRNSSHGADTDGKSTILLKSRWL